MADMKAMFWWAFHILVLLFCAGFLLLGITMLRRAYGMEYPLNFFIAFFGSSMMILVSAALILGLVVKMILRWRNPVDKQLNRG